MKTSKQLLIIILLFIINSLHLKAQVTESNNAITSGSYVGTSNNENVVFKAFGSTYMTLTTGGNLGIGTATPAELLDVNGNINVANTQFYSINEVRQLYVRGTSNLMVGNSGNTTLTGQDNIAVGEGAGTSLTSANFGTFIGRSSGNSTTTGTYNAFLGYHSGRDNTIGQYNTYLGTKAGRDNVTGSNNVAVGT